MIHMHRRTALCRAWLLLPLAVVVGCGDSRPRNTGVSGRIEVSGGIPLGEGKLVLIPDDPAAGQRPAGATIASDGTFSCYSASGGRGIPPGGYKVMVSFASGMAGPHPLRAAFKKYTSLESTPLRLDVPQGGLSNVVLQLQDEAG